MRLTTTLLCSGQLPYDCDAEFTMGYVQSGPYAVRLVEAARANGWTIRTNLQPVASTEAFCPVCVDRLTDLADGQTSIPYPDGLRSLLSLVGVKVTVEEVTEWPPEWRRSAERWASALHLSASDNPVPVPEKPQFL